MNESKPPFGGANAAGADCPKEKILSKNKNGMAMLVTLILLYLVGIAATVIGAIMMANDSVAGTAMFVVAVVYISTVGWMLFFGLKILKPQEALVLTLFGRYVGTLKDAGFYYVNPLCVSVNPAAGTKLSQSGDVRESTAALPNLSLAIRTSPQLVDKKISLKIMTLSNSIQKINDCLGNPVEISIAVTWQVCDTAKAVFNVDNYKAYLSLQCDSALRNVVRMYPYDVARSTDPSSEINVDEESLRGSSSLVAQKIRDEIQASVESAGIEIIEARITYLAYAPEIASVMLQRQQASAVIDARKMIVDGAVGMVEMALDRLLKCDSVVLDDERKAAMVSNLLVVLCANKDTQPVINSGSLY